jgi:hypothetical protein
MNIRKKSRSPALLDVVALLEDQATDNLARGQVGTVVENAQNGSLLVEFSDDDGRAYAIVSCPAARLMVLHYVPQAA